ncbi:MAG TPA: flagellar assembly protein FliX [Rhizomicrobium sp.]|nr:flagellar assembly protein FliX [Rhizomicrobium sp.]
MEIKGPARVDSSGVRRVPRASTQAGGAFSVTESEQPHAQMVTAPNTIAAVDSILMLQSIDDSTSGPSKGLAHGQQLLDVLDQVRDGLLSGGVPRSTLNRLAVTLGKRQDNFADPRLQSVLDEIELRARVELAKLEQADQAAA